MLCRLAGSFRRKPAQLSSGLVVNADNPKRGIEVANFEKQFRSLRLFVFILTTSN